MGIKELHCLQSFVNRPGGSFTCIFYETRRLPLLCQCFRKSSASKTAQNGTQQLPRTSASLASGNEVGKNLDGAVGNEESLMPMIMPNNFIDAKVLSCRICCISLSSIPPLCVCKIYFSQNCVLNVLY